MIINCLFWSQVDPVADGRLLIPGALHLLVDAQQVRILLGSGGSLPQPRLIVHIFSRLAVEQDRQLLLLVFGTAQVMAGGASVLHIHRGPGIGSPGVPEDGGVQHLVADAVLGQPPVRNAGLIASYGLVGFLTP